MKRRLIVLFAAIPAFVAQPVSAQTTNKAPTTNLRDLQVAMRDGVHLTTDVFLPAATGRWPAVLVRTPYSRHSPFIRSYRVL